MASDSSEQSIRRRYVAGDPTAVPTHADGSKFAPKDRANNSKRVPNFAPPIVWHENAEEFYEPHRHSSVGDAEAAAERNAAHSAESNKN
jgi:hypothetical protein